ncbi:hypothetical protein NMG60_11021631 [Bertholletia excelsa]
MAKSKGPSKKQKQRGVDFKKIKRKVGRKLPPPKNATNTEIKSKAIILPEQSVASEKAGLAVSRKGLTLKELLQQTSHHNPKVRKDALAGIRDIFLKHPAELRLHKLAVIEKLRERINDDDKLVREMLHQLLKSVIFPGCKEDNQGPLISLMMAYIFNAMTHLAIDVRLMAFKFLDLVVQQYPSSFYLYAEKIFQNYEDILRKNQLYLQENGKLKNALAGLVRCLSFLPSEKEDLGSHFEKDVAVEKRVLHAFEPEAPKDPGEFSVINNKLKDLMPVLVCCLQDLVPSVHNTLQVDPQAFECMLLILQGIDLVVRFFVYQSTNRKQEVEPYGTQDTTTWAHVSMPRLLKKLFDLFPLYSVHRFSGKDNNKYFVLNVLITEIFLHSSDWLCPPVSLLEKFLEFIASTFSEQICNRSESAKLFHEKHLLPLIPFIPKLIFQLEGHWKSQILQAFTKVFKSCSLESSLKWACLSAVEQMLFSRQGLQQHLDAGDPELLDYQISWIRELPLLLNLLGDKNLLHSRDVLKLLLRLGQCAASNIFFAQEYDNMQYSVAEFYCARLDESNVSYGPFVRLDRDAQELSVCCLYYFSMVDSHLLKSLAWCCLYDGLEPFIIFRIMEVLHSSYKVGRIQIADHISFFVTLLSCFKGFPGKFCRVLENDEISNQSTLRSITSVVCSSLLQMGDDYLVFPILEKVVLDQILLKPDLDNLCSLLRVLVALDCRPSRLSQQSIFNLSNVLPEYLINAVSSFPEDEDESPVTVLRSGSCYYLLPCFFLFHRSDRLLNLVLNVMGTTLIEISSISAIVTVILRMHKDVKIQKFLHHARQRLT